MGQLHLYLPDELAETVRQRARARGQSVSAYLATLVRSQFADAWPEGYFERVVGSWVGDPLERAEPLDAETRQEIDVSARRERLHPNTE